MEESRACVVVGGGPAGLVVGLLLARAGVPVTVLEKHADFLRDFRGDTVHPSTLELLDQLGLFERFQQLPHSRIEEMRIPTAGGGTMQVADLRQLRVSHPYVAMAPQWHFLNLLADAASAEPTFELVREAEAVDLIWDSDRVAGVVYQDREGQEHRIRASLTIAADGRGSVLRARAQLDVRSFRVPMDAWWFRVPTVASIGESLLPRGVDGRVFGVIPREGYAQIAQLIPKGADAHMRQEGVESFRAGVAAAVPELTDAIESVELSDVKLLNIEQNRLPRWHRPGLLCIGDSAHAMSPVGGVGVNLAIQDGVAAATILSTPLKSGRAPAQELRMVQLRREFPTKVTQWIQRRMHTLIFRVIKTRGNLVAPGFAVMLFTSVPALRRWIARLLTVGVRPESAPDFARRPTEDGR